MTVRQQLAERSRRDKAEQQQRDLRAAELFLDTAKDLR